MKKLSRLTPLLPFIPFFAFAQNTDFSYFANSAGGLLGLINNFLIPLLFGVAVLTFLWGVFKAFILGGGEEEKQKEGKQLMMYAIGGFILMVALWGIVNLATDVLGINEHNEFTPPATPTIQG